ncbi:MAG: hypothetical protein M3275_07210 [Thermoproteota archaeon]|nr:hypothetical protein [Thermoproteota archaeon]
MTITGKHYHFATGKSSKNCWKFYLCPNKTNKAEEGCCIYPAYRDPEGKELIIDTRHELVLHGLLSNDDDLTLEQGKESLDSPCILGLNKKKVISVTTTSVKEKKKKFLLLS